MAKFFGNLHLVLLTGFVLALAVAVTIGLFWNLNRWAGALLLPYLGWVEFAASLNAGVSALN